MAAVKLFSFKLFTLHFMLSVDSQHTHNQSTLVKVLYSIVHYKEVAVPQFPPYNDNNKNNGNNDSNGSVPSLLKCSV